MSSVAFHSLDHKTVRVGGGERAMAGALCDRLMHGVLDYGSFPKLTEPPLDRLIRLFRDDHYIRDYARRGDVDRTVNAMRTALGGFGSNLMWNGHAVEEFALALNTALAIGSDSMRFLARMHGTCEIHGWIDAVNRNWIADLIEDGTTSGVIRTAYQTQYENWPGIVAMLRSSSASAVIMSYSVTDSFPNFAFVSEHDFDEVPWNKMTDEQRADYERQRDEYDELDEGEQWSRAMAALKEGGGGLEMKPENWKTFRFAHGLSALDLLAPDWERRFDRAFPKEAEAA